MNKINENIGPQTVGLELFDSINAFISTVNQKIMCKSLFPNIAQHSYFS